MSLFRSLFGRTPVQETRSAPESQPPESSEDQQDRRKRQRVNARPLTRVLIVDDSATIVAALAKTLVSTGYTTFQAYDAESAIELARQEQPELIFLDIVLPGMNGFAALRQMRRDPLTRHIPIIMISGNEQATEQFYANRIGADDFMKKPFSRSEVFAKIEPLLDADMVPRRRNFAPHEIPPTQAAPAAPTAPAQPPSHAPTTLPQVSTEAPARTATPQSVPAVVADHAAPAAPADTSPATQAFVAPVAPPLQTAPPAQPAVSVAAPASGQTGAPVSPAAPVTSPAQAPAPVAAAPLPAGAAYSALEARKELTAMGLQYFDQNQFIAAIQRGDKLAFELFVAGGGVDLTAEQNGKTPLQIARENGRTQIFALLRARLALQKAEEEQMPPE